VEPVSEQPLAPEQTIAQATRLLADGRPFSAHEVFEARWKDGPDAERGLWQGLAQLCVALTHARRGNRTGATRLVERGARHLESYTASGGPTYGLDLHAWVEQAREEVSRSG
jgi:predicted metal-dependent hydrolase